MFDEKAYKLAYLRTPKMKEWKKQYYKNVEKLKRKTGELKIKRSESSKKYYNKNYKINRQKYIDKHNKFLSTLKGRFTAWKWNAKSKKMDWNVSFDYLKSLPLVCSYTGDVLTLEPNKPNSISIDRIDSSKGYTEDNICLCLHRANIAKNRWSKEDFFALCKKVYLHNESKV